MTIGGNIVPQERVQFDQCLSNERKHIESQEDFKYIQTVEMNEAKGDAISDKEIIDMNDNTVTQKKLML